MAGGVLTLLGAGAVMLVAAPGFADTHESVTVTGIDLAEPLEVSAEEQPELYAALVREVSWLVGRDGDTGEPDLETLGPQYTMVMHSDDEAQHRFHLYPLAEGGPRAFRPAEQPGDQTADEAWFFGRLSMPEILHAAGAPLTGDPAEPGGGTGAGQVEPPPDSSDPPARGMLDFLDEWREGMLLTVAVVVAIVAGLGGAAYLLRNYV